MTSSTRQCRPLWQGCLSAGFLLGLISSAAAQDHEASLAESAGTAGVEVTDDLLTLHADGAPLAEVLRAIGEAGSFSVVLRGAFAMPIRESFADRPLEDAIRRLVEGHSVVILREHPDPAAGAADLAEIRVIENPARAASESETWDEPSRGSTEAAQDDAADDPPIDREAFRLANLGVPPPTREGILFELDEPDPAARMAAVPKVGSLRPHEAIEVISYVLSSDEDRTVRSRAVAALTRLEGPGARMLLRERALGDEDASLRMQALNALATSAGDRSVNALGRALRQDPEPEVREAAIRALQRVGGDWGRRYVERAALDLDPEISLAAEQALATWPESPD